MGLVVPVSAAVLDTTAGAGTPAAAVGQASAGSAFFLHGAPQPLLLMALGALVVLIPVTRRALRTDAPASPASPTERARN